jgi:pimeloyl-ACP methyl ester carboxylesterase
MEQLNARIAGQDIAYLQTPGGGGDDDRAVVFVHGNSSSARTWLPVLNSSFGQRFRCLALDLPGHGQSAPARDQADYSLPGYASVLTGFAGAAGAVNAVFVGWSLGGQIILEAAPDLPDAAGFFIFGAPPVGSAAQLAEAFRPSPSMNTAFTPSPTESEIRTAVGQYAAPGAALDTSELVAEYQATDGNARAGLAASVADGRFADELAIIAALPQPLAIVAGAEDQLVNLDYLQKLAVPTLWRGAVQVIANAGHALQQEVPDQFTALLTDFLGDLDRLPGEPAEA